MEKPGMLQSMGSERVRHVQQMITAVGPTALAQRHLRNVLQAREREREAGLFCWEWSRRSCASLLSQAMSTSLCPGPQEAECKREGLTSFNARCARCPVRALWGKHLTSQPRSLPPSVNQREVLWCDDLCLARMQCSQ